MNQYFDNNNNLKSERRIIKYNYGSLCLSFISDNGVFSKNHIDYGSELLIETLLANRKVKGKFLDVGCGYGFISIVLSKLGMMGVGVDVNKRALKLASDNAKLNKVLTSFVLSDCYSNINDSYDLIITNPPIRAGKSKVLEILKGAYSHLNDEGELWFVIRKDQGANSIKKELDTIYKINILEKSKGFYIFVAKKS